MTAPLHTKWPKVGHFHQAVANKAVQQRARAWWFR